MAHDSQYLLASEGTMRLNGMIWSTSLAMWVSAALAPFLGDWCS
jgi:hypothetical protein